MAENRTSLLKRIVIMCIVPLVGALIALAGSSGGQKVGGVSLYVLVVAAAFAVQWVAFVPAFRMQTEKFFDLVGGATYFFLTLALILLVPESGPRSIILAMCVMLWSARLATFLFLRVRRAGKDGRFDGIKPDAARFFNVWNVQGLWITFTASGAWIGITSPSQSQHVDVFLIVGLALWVLGFGIEIVSDLQKSRFKQNPENRGRFINVGLWSWSRHPNYFGEILLWAGIAVMVIPLLSGWSFVALLSPVFVFLLLRFVSGVPLLEKSADKRWSGDADYEHYKATTSLLVPRRQAV